ncbi:Integrator complex subunit 6 [Thelohanellus kitauei]|uniref:Integrator complex subunit 6 n=1 Tax=Thelohanellus kitauei TaxID=669202 RepID=A0A0C2N7Z0_THEKT|nr:Integrator complex subunit 6 [Thelohanellus kitauei]
MASFVYFVIDTCAAMNQVITGGITYIDVVKASVESLIKYRIRSDQSSNRPRERYMLVYYDFKNRRVCKSSLRETCDKLLTRLKFISCAGVSKLAQSLQETFEFINIARLSSGIESFSCGRKPMYIEPSAIIILTISRQTYNVTLNAMTSHREGMDLYAQPYRWDEKLFTIYFTSPRPMKNGTAGTCSPLNELSAETGGFVTSCSNVNHSVTELNRILDFVRRTSIRINIHIIKESSMRSEGRVNRDIPPEVDLPAEQRPAQRPTIYACLMHVPLNLVGVYSNWPIPESYNQLKIVDKIPPRLSIPNMAFDLDKPTKIVNQCIKPDIYSLENPVLFRNFRFLNEEADFEV